MGNNIFKNVQRRTHSVIICPLTSAPNVANRKYIQVCVQNVSEMDFHLVEQSLSEREGTSLELQSLNAKTQQVNFTHYTRLRCSHLFSPFKPAASKAFMNMYVYDLTLHTSVTLVLIWYWVMWCRESDVTVVM